MKRRVLPSLATELKFPTKGVHCEELYDVFFYSLLNCSFTFGKGGSATGDIKRTKPPLILKYCAGCQL